MQCGFTLIELLVVIAIVAVLATSVVLVLNPAELVKQARDSTRISDLALISGAVSLYLAEVKNPGLGGPNNASCATPFCRDTSSSTASLFNNIASCSTNSSTTVDGTGWVAVDFAEIGSGPPFARLPIDPINDNNYFYTYACTGLNYEIDANMESAKFGSGGAADVESKDGGNQSNYYEVGNKLDCC